MKIVFGFLLQICFALPLLSQNPSISLAQYATGFQSPVDIENAGDDRLFVVEQRGVIYILDSAGNRLTTPFLDIRSRVRDVRNEQGLLGLVFHPDYKNNGWFFVNYTDNTGATVVSRFEVSPTDSNVAVPGTELALLTIAQPFSNHNAGDMNFGPDGYLYIGTGDGGSGGDPDNRSQNPLDLLGKMLRVQVEGNGGYLIPFSNPFFGMASTRNEIWSIGLRNPWRFSFDRVTGDMWIADVGQNDYEEIDYQPASSPGGENYGWRCHEGNSPFNLGNCTGSYTFPVYEYGHSNLNGCSVTGGYVYRGARYSGLYGLYLFTDYCSGTFYCVKPAMGGGFSGQQLITLDRFEYSSFGEDRYGELYVAGHGNGIIYKLADTTCTPNAVILAPDTGAYCTGGSGLQALEGAGMQYQWYLNGSPVNGATSSALVPSGTGSYQVEVTNPGTGCSALSAAVNVNALSAPPVVSLSGLDPDYCFSDAPVSMTGSPAGGTFWGAGVNGNSFDPLAAGIGTYVIEYRYTDSLGCEGVDTHTVLVRNCLGTNPEEALVYLRVFPNPVQGDLNVSFGLTRPDLIGLRVMNVAGQVVMTERHAGQVGSNSLELSLGSLRAGVYLVEVEVEEKRWYRRVLVQ